MRILIADDDMVSLRMLEAMLDKWGYEVISCPDGSAAWNALTEENPPPVAILDWMMPGLDGVQVCHKVRKLTTLTPPYIILLTTRREKQDIVTGLQGGADDYVVKPFDRQELQARLQVALRVVNLQHNLAQRVAQLEQAMAHVRQLQKLLPICSYCKRIRNDQDYWEQAESYISKHSDTKFSHSICPDCYEKVTKELEELERQTAGGVQAWEPCRNPLRS